MSFERVTADRLRLLADGGTVSDSPGHLLRFLGLELLAIAKDGARELLPVESRLDPRNGIGLAAFAIARVEACGFDMRGDPDKAEAEAARSLARTLIATGVSLLAKGLEHEGKWMARQNGRRNAKAAREGGSY